MDNPKLQLTFVMVNWGQRYKAQVKNLVTPWEPRGWFVPER